MRAGWERWLVEAVRADPRNELLIHHRTGEGLAVRMTHRDTDPNVWSQETCYLGYLLEDPEAMLHAVQNQARQLNMSVVNGGPYGPSIRKT